MKKTKRQNIMKKLDSLFRTAILKIHKCCIFCGESNPDNLEVHHYIRRSIKLLRYDFKNGFPLCKIKGCHNIGHIFEGDKKLTEFMGEDQNLYLYEKQRINFKQYLIDNGITDQEFFKSKEKELQDIINDIN